MNKKIAFLTCRDFTGVGSHDDHLLISYLKEKNVEVSELIWNDPQDFEAYDLVLVRTTWDYSEHKEQFAAVLKNIQKKVPLFNPIDLMLWNMEKTYLRELSQIGVETIPTLWFASDKKLIFDEICERLKSKEFILKPSVGAGSSGLIRVSSQKDLENLPARLYMSPLIMAQPFIREVLDGEKSFLYFEGKFSHAISKVPKEGDFRSQEEFGGVVTSFIPSTKEKELCQHILQKLPITPLYARLDFLPFEKRLLLIELEMIEPHLYLSWDDNAAKNIGDALLSILKELDRK